MSKQDMVQKAIVFAMRKHVGQKDDSKKNYFEAHVYQVYSLVKRVTDDIPTQVAALLHDTLEDTNTQLTEIKEEFGKEVADLVNEVTHEGKKDDYGFYFPRLETEKAIIIKFADRLSNLSRMDTWPKNRKAQYLKRSKFWKDGSDLK